VDDLAAVISDIVGGPANVVGASLGGRIALDLAVTQPALLWSVALLGSAVSGVEPEIDDPPAGDRLDQVRVPVLVVVGSLDLEDIRLTADLLTERLPGSSGWTCRAWLTFPPWRRPATWPTCCWTSSLA
jgi:dienelactone hydrolase